jgi:uncharacterized protein
MSTQPQPTLDRITIYPIKSLDGILVNSAEISAGGALRFDRRWAIVDADDKIVNAKRTAKIQQLRSQFDLSIGSIDIQAIEDNIIHSFSLHTELPTLAKWLSEFFGFPVSLIENPLNGFPDDPDAYGPTIVSTMTLERICTWFPDLNLDEVRRRFRTNLELRGVPAFWEDRLFTAPGAVVDFQLGDVQFQGINPCQRCIVPTRDSLTGNAKGKATPTVTTKFQQRFNQHRQDSLPDWVNPARFNHFYRLAVNTQIPIAEAGKILNIGDLLLHPL